MNRIQLNTIGDSPVVVKKGSQVQSQEKTVEITENGTTEVVPDSGFSLSKVTVNANVESSGSAMEYLDVSDWDKTDMLNKALLSTAQLFRLNANGTVAVATNDSGAINYCEAVGVDFSLELISNGKIMTLGEGWAQSLTEEGLAAIPRITKEEFYNLEA